MLNLLSNMEMEIDSLTNCINIYWDEYELREVKSYVLVRKRYSIPRNINDGYVVFDGLDTECSDTNIKNGELYYYRLFICFDEDKYSNNVISDSKCVAKAIGFTNTTDYGELIYNTFPEQVKYDDYKQNKNFPLKRFMQTIAFPFNRIDTYADAMLEQLDIDTCDEIFLPYFARWNGKDYNYHFGSDLNRLILKTLNDAEPYMGTEQGVVYILQRIFKAEVKIELGNSVALDVRLNLDSNNIWLLEYIDYIKDMIKEYCALSVNYAFVSSLIDIEKRKAKTKEHFLDYLITNNEEITTKESKCDVEEPTFKYSRFSITNGTTSLTNTSLFTCDNYI